MRHRDRQSQTGLLPRMEAIPRKNGFLYRYHVPGGRPISLGRDKAEAIRKVLDMTGQASDTGTINWLWREYQETRKWAELSERTQADYKAYSGPLLAVFGKVQATSIKASDVARYLDQRSAPVRANREKSLLSNLLALAIRKGFLESNAANVVARNTERARTRDVEPRELEAFLRWCKTQGPSMMTLAAMAEFAAFTGCRRKEFLNLSWTQVGDEVIRLPRAKQRGKIVVDVVEITKGLAGLIERLRAVAKDDRVGFVFPNQRGNAYTEQGFKSMWSKLVARALAEQVVGERFTFHDLRAYHVTQYKKLTGTLPDLHSNPGTTARIYDRAKEVKRRGL